MNEGNLLYKYHNINVVIMMATFNGEKFIAEQIESILSQRYENWTLLIRDDGSTDMTLSIIHEYIAIDERVELLSDDKGPTGSSMHNFDLLCEEALKKNYEYYFFSDQDDVWDKDKIEIYLNNINSLDKDAHCKPLLFYSDLSIIDEEKNLIHQSFMRFQGLKNVDEGVLKILLTQNHVTGCAMMMNKSLLETACPFPKKIIMHDWWLALCAASVGKIVFIDQSLVNYRQHNSNVVGAKGFWSPINPFRGTFIAHWKNSSNRIKSTIFQAQALNLWLEKSDIDSADSEQKLINAYASLLSVNRIVRLKIILSRGIGRKSKLMTLIFMVRILLMSRKQAIE